MIWPVGSIIFPRSNGCQIQRMEGEGHKMWSWQQLCYGVWGWNSQGRWSTLHSWVAACKVEGQLSKCHWVNSCMHLWNHDKVLDCLHFEMEGEHQIRMRVFQDLLQAWWHDYTSSAKMEWKIANRAQTGKTPFSLLTCKGQDDTWESKCKSIYSAARESPPMTFLKQSKRDCLICSIAGSGTWHGPMQLSAYMPTQGNL